MGLGQTLSRGAAQRSLPIVAVVGAEVPVSTFAGGRIPALAQPLELVPAVLPVNPEPYQVRPSNLQRPSQRPRWDSERPGLTAARRRVHTRPTDEARPSAGHYVAGRARHASSMLGRPGSDAPALPVPALAAHAGRAAHARTRGSQELDGSARVGRWRTAARAAALQGVPARLEADHVQPRGRVHAARTGRAARP